MTHELPIINEDNRDPNCTELTVSLGIVRGQPSSAIVKVDPTELFKNMIENLGPDKSVIYDMMDWLDGEIKNA